MISAGHATNENSNKTVEKPENTLCYMYSALNTLYTHTHTLTHPLGF